MRVVDADGTAGELAALVATVATAPAPAVGEPALLATAIAAFRAGDCETATNQIGEVSRSISDLDPAFVRTELWRAGIAQRCGRIEDARAVLVPLVREHPDARVDLAELWPSLADLVEEVRRQTRPTSRRARDLLAGNTAVAREVAGGAGTVVVAGEAGSLRAAVVRRDGVTWSHLTRDPHAAFAWVVASLAPTAPVAPVAPVARTSQTLVAADLALVAAGQDSIHAGVAASWQGSGLGARVSLRRSRAVVELAGGVIAYPDSGGEATAGGGWEWNVDLRAGIRSELGDRFAVAALATASANDQQLVAPGIPFVGRTHVGVGAAARVEVRLARSLGAVGELGYAPIGFIRASMAGAETPTVVSC
ncbi:MAG TPA: hypothetical protein VIU61_12235, partial [Kofleriaceae bacterium]